MELKTDKASLRKFGFLIGLLIPIFFGLLLPWLWSKPIPRLPFYLGGPLIILALIAPKLLLYVYLPWMKFGAVAGWINTRIILGVIYYLLFTPLAVFFKIIGRDTLKRKFDSDLESYRIIPAEVVEDYDRIKRMKYPF
ncbi:MAG: sxtJ [Halobacteriovoraceae bacterium]|nr:sxtJ [Halobacteriovoraceae bacterium]